MDNVQKTLLQIIIRLLSSGLLCGVVLWSCTDVSEEHASIPTEDDGSMFHPETFVYNQKTTPHNNLNSHRHECLTQFPYLNL